MKKITNTVSLFALSQLPSLVLAEKVITENNDGSLLEFLQSIQNWLVGIVGSLTILFIVYGGFLYITSGGNQQKVDTAKKTLTYAIVGLIIVILANLILNIITGDFLPGIFNG